MAFVSFHAIPGISGAMVSFIISQLLFLYLVVCVLVTLRLNVVPMNFLEQTIELSSRALLKNTSSFETKLRHFV